MTEFEIFQQVVSDSYKQREVDELERMARAVECGNATLADLPPEGEWLG